MVLNCSVAKATADPTRPDCLCPIAFAKTTWLQALFTFGAPGNLISRLGLSVPTPTVSAWFRRFPETEAESSSLPVSWPGNSNLQPIDHWASSQFSTGLPGQEERACAPTASACVKAPLTALAIFSLVNLKRDPLKRTDVANPGSAAAARQESSKAF
jgi:hypothetical protein